MKTLNLLELLILLYAVCGICGIYLAGSNKCLVKYEVGSSLAIKLSLSIVDDLVKPEIVDENNRVINETLKVNWQKKVRLTCRVSPNKINQNDKTLHLTHIYIILFHSFE